MTAPEGWDRQSPASWGVVLSRGLTALGTAASVVDVEATRRAPSSSVGGRDPLIDKHDCNGLS